MTTQEPAEAAAALFSTEDVRLIADLGFTALACGEQKAARQILDALVVLRPESEASLVAEASYQLMSRDPSRAAEILRGAAPSDPVSTMLAISLMTAGKMEEGQKVLEEAASTFGDDSIAARTLGDIQQRPATE